MFLLLFFFQYFNLLGLESNGYNGFYFEDSRNRFWVSSPMAWNCTDTFNTSIFRTPQHYIQSSIFEDHNGTLYSTSQNNLLVKLKGESSFRYLKVEYGKNILQDDYHISYIDTVDKELLFSADKSLYWVDYETYKVKEKISESDCRRFHFNQERKLIIGCPWILSEGLEMYFRQDGVWSTELIKSSEFNFRVSQVIFENNLAYLATDKGLVEFDLDSRNVRVVSDSSKCSKINSIVKYNETIIFSSKNCDLKFYDMYNKKIVNSKEIESLNQSLRLSNPKELFIDSNNFLYISTPGENVQKVDLNLIKIKNTSISDSEVLKILKTDVGIVLLTNSGRLIYYGRNNVEIERLDVSDYNSKIIDVEYIDSFLYIATLDFIYKVNIDSKSISKTEFNFNETILNVFQFNSEVLVGTTESVYILDDNVVYNQKDEFLKFGVDEITGIVCHTNSCVIQNVHNNGYYYSNDTLFQLDYNIVFDLELIKDEYYISTSEGLVVLNKGGAKVSIYPQIENEILGFSIKGDTALIVTQNEIYYSIGDDLIKYPYEFEHTFISQFPVIIDEGFIVNHKNGYYEIPDNIWKSYNKSPELRLMYNENVINGNLTVTYLSRDIKFKTKVFDSYDIEKVQFQYALDGSTYSSVPSSGEIELNNLATGSHDLYLRVVGSNEVVKKQLIEITVLPPYHETWWFRSLAVLGLVVIGFFISYLRTRQKVKKQQIQLDRQEALQNQRNRMSQDLHDEMGSGLSAIKHLSATKSTGDKDVQIESIATNLIRSMRDLLWSLDESNDTVHSLSVKIRQTANQLLRNSAIKHHIKVALLDDDIPVSGPTRRNIILVIKELINNALKHSGASDLDFLIHSNRECLYIEVRDNGVGYDASLAATGYGLKSIQKRLKDIGAKSSIASDEGGTHIKIELPLV